MEILTSGFNVLLIILGFGLLIFVHELGHFVAAKWAGIRTEAFAVGMGPVMLAWRKGIGLRLGSTAKAYEKRVLEHLANDPEHHLISRRQPDDQRDDSLPQAEMYRIGDKIGLGETEYSLRWLPIGGFVKMLGQEDANPNYVSNDPRSYTMCPVGKRMIVVSAGVIMNIILAIALFIIAFMVGVRFEAPVVGEVIPTLPAALTRAANATQLGIETVGLQPGDQVVAIDGEPARTFADLQIASAMSKPGVPVRFTVRRDGIADPLHFSLMPEKDQITGLLSVGIIPGASSTLSADNQEMTARELHETGLSASGVKPGMRLVTVNGTNISTFGQLSRAADASNGQPLQTVWQEVDRAGNLAGRAVHAPLLTHPELEVYFSDDPQFDEGLLGLTPLVQIAAVSEDSPNRNLLQAGDIIVRMGDVRYPRRSQVFDTVAKHSGESIMVGVLRNSEQRMIECKVTSKGQLLIHLALATESMLTAQPILSQQQPSDGSGEPSSTPIAAANLLATGGTQVLAVNDQPVNTWAEFRQALRDATAAAHDSGSDASVTMLIAHPTPGNEQQEISVSLSAAQVRALHKLGWRTHLSSFAFEPLQVLLTANGNVLKAVSMGFSETKKLVVMTYLTIDRLVRGSVGVDQLRGPIGIVHIGSKVADRGFMYLIFFLGMISVNLAVINFLPMPIVDGGLFLFLVYEKFKGRPPSLAFQNAATVVGLSLIVTLFLVVTWNDVWRLIG